MAIELTDDNFQKTISNSNKPVLVDFWAEWCGPCRMLAPIIEELSNSMKDKIDVCKVDVEASPNISSELSIRSIPTLILFKNGEAIGSRSGALSKEAIEAWVNDLLK